MSSKKNGGADAGAGAESGAGSGSGVTQASDPVALLKADFRRNLSTLDHETRALAEQAIIELGQELAGPHPLLPSGN